MSQELNSKVLDLVKQKGLHPYEYISGFESLKRKIATRKENFYSSLIGKKN